MKIYFTYQLHDRWLTEARVARLIVELLTEKNKFPFKKRTRSYERRLYEKSNDFFLRMVGGLNSDWSLILGAYFSQLKEKKILQRANFKTKTLQVPIDWTVYEQEQIWLSRKGQAPISFVLNARSILLHLVGSYNSIHLWSE